MFSDGPINHYKIIIPFIYYGDSYTNYFAIQVGMQGKLKSGAILTTSENLKVALTARRIVEY